MRRFTTFLLFAVVCFFTVPHQPIRAAAPEITSQIVLKDRSSEANRLLEDAYKRAEELKALYAAQSVDGPGFYKVSVTDQSGVQLSAQLTAKDLTN